jgi:hypothetical protein
VHNCWRKKWMFGNVGFRLLFEHVWVWFLWHCECIRLF